MSGGMTLLRTLASLVLAAAVTAPTLAQTQENARVTTEAYIYLYPDSTRKPFAHIEADSLVTILGAEGDWLNITLLDA